MKRVLVTLVATMALAGLVVAGCSQATPAAAPTKAAEPAKAAAPAAQPTAAAATQPTAAPTAAAAVINYPVKGKPITMQCPFAAGGGTDVSARIFADALQKDLGTSVEVINKAGANGQVGTTEFVRQKTDGYYIMANNLPALASYYLDPEKQATFGRKDILPIAVTVVDAGIFIVKADSPYKTVKDVIDAAKANPEKVKVGDTGVLSGPHLNTLLVQRMAGVKFASVHFDGASSALTALMGEHVDVQAGYVGDVLSSIKSGQARALGVMDKQESPFLPGVPTFESQGFKVYQSAARAFQAPAGTPKEIVKVLSDSLKKASESPDVKKKMDDMGLAIRFMDSDAFAAFWTENEDSIKVLIDDAKKQQQ